MSSNRRRRGLAALTAALSFVLPSVTDGSAKFTANPTDQKPFHLA
ncbi:hypothetical protein [Streptomyces collinus]